MLNWSAPVNVAEVTEDYRSWAERLQRMSAALLVTAQTPAQVVEARRVGFLAVLVWDAAEAEEANRRPVGLP